MASSLVTWYFRETLATGTLQGSYSHTYPQQIRAFPVRQITFGTPSTERKQRAGEIQHLAKSFVTSHQPLTRSAYTAAPLYTFIADRLSAKPEEQSDVVHDLLAELAGQMIEMNKEKQAHLREFRLNLAGYLDEKQQARLNRLYTPKKPPAEGIKNYEQKVKVYQQAVQLAQAGLGQLAGETLDLDDFWRLNQAQWMWLLRQNLGQVGNMSSLVSLYQQYHHQLAPLMRRLYRTDWLIDQVVYQLYGLTEEEIKVVEGE